MTLMDSDLAHDARVHEPQLWQALTAAVAEMRDIWATDPRVDTPLLEAEGTRYLTRLLAAGIPVTMEAWDFDYPFLVKFLSPHLQFGIPAADCCYHWAAVHGDGVYRIRGKRGTAHLFDVEARSGHTAHLADWKLVDRRSEFAVEDDGTIEVVLSAAEQPGNWVRIADGPGVTIMRQYYYDWDTEEAAALVIERDGVTYPPPPLRPEQIGERLELLIAWIRKVGAACRFAINEYYEAEPGALNFVAIDFAWADLLYGKGTYTCARDEAVILSVTPPQAAYWQYQLTSHFWEALDYNLRQTSLNGHQAVLDGDGVFRAVIAHEDPGVANWLDAGGHTTGLITARYYKADSTPGPTFETVPLASVRDHLPADTTLVGADERQDALKRRARSVWRRRV